MPARSQPGKLADIVLVEGNPLENIGEALKVRRVIANGRSYTLEELLKGRQALADARDASGRHADLPRPLGTGESDRDARTLRGPPAPGRTLARHRCAGTTGDDGRTLRESVGAVDELEPDAVRDRRADDARDPATRSAGPDDGIARTPPQWRYAPITT